MKILNATLWGRISFALTIGYVFLVWLDANHGMVLAVPWYVALAPGFIVLALFLASILESMISGK